MVIDAFYFYNEHELLEARLNILDKYVDQFIIIESSKDFMGNDRELQFVLPEKFKNKIVYYVVNKFDDRELWNMALLSPNTGAGEKHWLYEFYIKESMRKAFTHLQDDDIVYISDIDEVWNPSMVAVNKDVIYKPVQTPYIYYFNNRTDQDWTGWTGTVVCKYSVVKSNSINHLRTDGMVEHVPVPNGGWHFSSLGGKDWKESHPGYNAEVWRQRELNMRKDNTGLPPYLLANQEKYAKFFL